MASTTTFARQLVQLMGKAKNFDRVMEKCKVIAGKPGQVIVSMKVEEEHCNGMNTLHGGLTATLVDSITTAAIMTSQEDGSLGLPGVSVDLNMSYLKAAHKGQTVTITADILRKGRTLIFTKATVLNENGDIVALGHHVKHVGGPMDGPKKG